jgi:hypothetical protein
MAFGIQKKRPTPDLSGLRQAAIVWPVILGNNIHHFAFFANHEFSG